MTARRRVALETETPGLAYLRKVLANSKASHADKMKAALALAGIEKAIATAGHEPGQRQRAREAAETPSSWDELLQQ